MSYVFMAFHYPKPEHRDELLRGMAELADDQSPGPPPPRGATTSAPAPPR